MNTRLRTSAGSRSSGTSTAPASGTHTRSAAQPRTARAQLLDDTDELVARRERRIRHAEIGPGAQHGIGIGHARGQHPDPDLARTRPGVILLNHPQDLGPAIVIDDDTLHHPHLLARPAPPPGRCSYHFLLIRLACSDRWAAAPGPPARH